MISDQVEWSSDSRSHREFVVRSVGVAHTPYKAVEDAPFQGRLAPVEASIEIHEEFTAALKDVDAATHLIVLYWAHLGRREVLQTRTPWGPEIRGVFACRSPSRPNPISFCVTELVRREGNRLVVRGLDAIDGSHVLDIKPYSSGIDMVSGASIDWFDRQQKEAHEPLDECVRPESAAGQSKRHLPDRT